MTTPITVVCVDDHPLTLQAIVSELERDGAFKVAGIGHNGADFVRLATTLNPDVVFLDVGMPAKEGSPENSFVALEAIAEVKQRCPEINIIILSGQIHESLLRSAANADVSAYVLKDVKSEMIRHIAFTVADGGTYFSVAVWEEIMKMRKIPPSKLKAIGLTEREAEVLRLIVVHSDKSMKFVADEAGISLETLKSHMKSIKQKMRVNTKAMLVLKAVLMGMAPPPQLD